MAKWRAWSTAGRRIALQRATAVRATGLLFPPDALNPSRHDSVDVGPLQPKKVFPSA
jgi:hypothetical protein